MSTKNMVVAPVATPEWLEKKRKIFGELERQVNMSVTHPGKGLMLDRVQALLDRKYFLDADFQVEEWRALYRGQFGLDVGTVKIPLQRKGVNRLIVIPQGLTLQQAYDVCKRHFSCWSCSTKLHDPNAFRNDRSPDVESYAIWAGDWMQANDHREKRTWENAWDRITLLERIMYELKYFLETGEHLDTEAVTVCEGTSFESDDRYTPTVCFRTLVDGPTFCIRCVKRYFREERDRSLVRYVVTF